MENKKYLTEENYQKGKKKLQTIALVILAIGIALGGGLILTGIIKINSVKTEIAENESKRTETDVKTEIADIEAKIDAIEVEITNLNTEKSKLRNEKSKIFQEDRGFSDRYYAKDEEITAKQNEITAQQKEKTKLQSSKVDLESELWKMQSGFNNTKNSISTSKYIPLCIFGAFIIIASCMISGFIYLFTKRREMLAFTAQQVIPVAKEGISEIAPTVGNAVGEIAKGITSGIKEGLNDDKNQE